MLQPKEYMSKRIISMSVGVFAYNEARNIGKVLDSLLKQKLDYVQIKEIIVISSGSFDRTNEIVRQYVRKHKHIQLVVQLKREGKSAAINEFMDRSKSNVLAIISGDLRLHTRAIEEIGLPFLQEDVGMVGCRPLPLNTQNNPLGKEIKLLWHFHHLVSLHNPKCGEMIAFRKVLKSIPRESAVDEATIEVMLHLIGFKVVYAPRSIVYNRGPKNISDFIKQRRRVYAGHLWVQERYHYQVSTLKTTSTANIIKTHLMTHPQDIIPSTKLVMLEIISRFLGWFDYTVLHKNPYIWNMVTRD